MAGEVPLRPFDFGPKANYRSKVNPNDGPGILGVGVQVPKHHCGHVPIWVPDVASFGLSSQRTLPADSPLALGLATRPQVRSWI